MTVSTNETQPLKRHLHSFVIFSLSHSVIYVRLLEFLDFVVMNVKINGWTKLCVFCGEAFVYAFDFTVVRLEDRMLK